MKKIIILCFFLFFILLGYHIRQYQELLSVKEVVDTIDERCKTYFEKMFYEQVNSLEEGSLRRMYLNLFYQPVSNHRHLENGLVDYSKGV